MYKIGILVPESHLEIVKNAMFEQGAGKLGDYEKCAWQVLGQGQFLPSKNATPFIGEADQLTQVAEYYVQVICKLDTIHQVIAALKKAHPYEEPAYEVIKIEDF